MKKAITSLMMLILLMVASCAPYQHEGAAVGGATGGVAGAILDSKNPWRGGIIGAALGAVLGATIADISVRGSGEAVRADRPVEYRTEDGRGVYQAEPLEYDPSTRCRSVRERIWEDGRLVKDRVREICESERYERRY